VAETLDWASALLALQTNKLDETILNHTLGVLLKYQDDVQLVQNNLLAELAERPHANPPTS
jgi:hypothetical protein